MFTLKFNFHEYELYYQRWNENIVKAKDQLICKSDFKKHPTKEDAIKVVDSPILVPSFRKDDYWYVDGFGDVIESNLSWNKDEMRKHIGHLFLFMKGEWQYSDNGIDWEPAVEALPMPRGEVA